MLFNYKLQLVLLNKNKSLSHTNIADQCYQSEEVSSYLAMRQVF